MKEKGKTGRKEWRKERKEEEMEARNEENDGWLDTEMEERDS